MEGHFSVELAALQMKKDYSVLLIQLGRNLASDISTRCSGRPQEMKTSYETYYAFMLCVTTLFEI